MSTADAIELPVTFLCENETLVGLIHQPAMMAAQGVLVVVGGPQYRVGSHRQFVLLARHLAANGIAVMRFDYRGMGDSEGEPRTFDRIDADIQVALDCFFRACPALEGVLLFGLCDAASAALFYGYQDVRVQGLILLNPWVHTEQGNAKTFLKHYYWQRLWNPTLWRKIMTLKFDYADAYRSILSILKTLYTRPSQDSLQQHPLPQRMRECWKRFKHPILLILSGRDLTASEFKEVAKSDAVWQQLLNDPRVTCHELAAANHTFSSQAWRDQVAGWVLEWINQKIINIEQQH